MGHVDAPKFYEVCTCFALAAEAEGLKEIHALFLQGVELMGKGEMDKKTVDVIKRQTKTK